MKIVSPVDCLAETVLLLDAGADELYGGYVPQRWREQYSLVASINQRTYETAQLSNLDELAAVVDLTRSRGKSFSLTLNAPFYTDDQYPLLLKVVDEAVEVGVAGIILADLALLHTLRKRHPHLEYHASTLAHLLNSSAIELYASLGISRTILPRHLTLEEMAQITSSLPTHRFDAFLLIGKCPNTEGLCTFHHTSPDKIWPCEIPYTITALNANSEPQDAMIRQQSWSLTNRRHGCGLCALPQLLKIGVFGVKLVGRGAPSQQKLSNIRLTREFLALARNFHDVEEFRRRARVAHHRRFGAPCSVNVCYYPETYLPGRG